MSDQRHYETVAQEIQRRDIRPGLWARAIAETGREDATARALYIRLRVAELIHEEQLEYQRRGADNRSRTSSAERESAHSIPDTNEREFATVPPRWAYICGIIVAIWLAAFVWGNIFN